MGDGVGPDPDLAIRTVLPADTGEWLRMRQSLWPDEPEHEARADMARMLDDPLRPVWVAVRPDGRLGGFAEGGVRAEAEGCGPGPIAYLEGWFVDPDLRGRGVGAGLVRELERWGRNQGCTELASDTWLDNDASIEAHRALGFEVTERLVFFRKVL